MAAAKGNKYAEGCEDSGRPPKYCKAILEKASKLYELGATEQEVADILGLDRTTLWDWCRKHEEFSNIRKIAKDKADDRVELSLYQQAVEGNVTAQRYWLNNRRRHAWQDRQQHDVKLGFNEFLESLEGEDD